MQEKGLIEISSKLKAQKSKPQLKTQNYLFCHPEDEVRRIPYQVSEGFFASLRMTIKKSKVKDQRSKR